MAKSELTARQVALFDMLDQPKAVLAFGYGSALGAGGPSHGVMRYLTGWDSHEAMSLFAYDGAQQVLLLSSPFVETLAIAHFDHTQIIPAPVGQWGNIIAEIFGTVGSFATVGFSDMPHAVFDGITRAVSDLSITGDTALARLRIVKSAKETSLLEKGAAICDALFAALPRFLSRENSASRSQLQLECHARLAGADYCKTWLSIAPRVDGPRYWPKEACQTPQDGDQILFGVALTVEGYWAHGIRMGSLGPAQPHHLHLWSAVHAALLHGEDTLRSDTPLANVPKTMSDCLDAHAAEHNWRDARSFRGGHGLGTSYEEPLTTLPFAQDWHPNFANAVKPTAITPPETSIFELHPNVFVPSAGGAALGEMYQVTNDKPRSLLHFPRDLMELSLTR